MKILVTGGLGFVGINLVRDLAAAFPQAEIIAADLLPVDDAIQSFLSPVQNRVCLERLNVCDRNQFDALVAQTRCTHLIHAAAVTPGQETETKRSPDIVDVNLLGAIHALRAAYRSDFIERFLFVSSSGVYGYPENDTQSLQQEDSGLQLDHLYGICKYSAELLTERYAQYTGKSMASIRLASIYGPMERATGARNHMSLPRRLMDALNSDIPLKLFGPTIGRDWLHTADVSLAVEKLFQTPKWQHAVYNVGAGASLPFAELISVFEHYGLQTQWVDQVEEADIALLAESARQALDISRLAQDTGYQPVNSGIKGMETFIRNEINAQKGKKA
jgi:UDP-glucose 4-epimerase